MDRLDEVKRQASHLYWLAFLLTGQSETSTDAVIESISLADDCSGPAPSLKAECRTFVITKALGAIRTELQASAMRLNFQKTEMAVASSDAALIDRDLTRAEVRTALLGIDALPRCAVVLRLMEGVPLE